MKSSRFLFAAPAVLFTGMMFAQAPAARTAIPNAAQPQLAAGSDGRVWLVYGRAAEAPAAPVDHSAHAASADGKKQKGQHQPPARSGDVFVARSDDNGATFAPAVKVAGVPQLMLGMRRGPRIAAHGKQLTVTVIARELLAFTSSDGGRTWSEPVTINEVPTSAREGLHDLTSARDGRTFVTWLDLRNGKTELWGAESTNGGRTWAKNEQVYRSPDKTICECCHPTALFDAEGNLAVMWRNAIEGSRDMWLATRPKGAKQFTPARKLGTGSWPLTGCPMDGGTILAQGGGKFAAVWQRAGDVFFSLAEGPETLLGKGKQPIGVAGRSGTVVFWQQGVDLVVARDLRQPKPEMHARDARFAVALALPGNRGTMLAYEQGPAKEKQPGIVVERL